MKKTDVVSVRISEMQRTLIHNLKMCEKIHYNTRLNVEVIFVGYETTAWQPREVCNI